MRYLLFIAILIGLPSISKADTTLTSFSDRFFDRSEYVNPWKIYLRFSWSKPMGNEDYTLNGSPIAIVGDDLIDNMFGFELGSERFVTDYVSLGLDLGYRKTKTDELTFNSGTPVTTEGSIGLIPLDFTINIHPAPYGAIDPYFGIGYNYTYATSSYDGINVDSSNGFLMRAGFNWLFDKNTYFNMDVKKQFMTLDADFSEISSTPGLKSETNLDPLTISVGVGYSF